MKKSIILLLSALSFSAQACEFSVLNEHLEASNKLIVPPAFCSKYPKDKYMIVIAATAYQNGNAAAASAVVYLSKIISKTKPITERVSKTYSSIRVRQPATTQELVEVVTQQATDDMMREILN